MIRTITVLVSLLGLGLAAPALALPQLTPHDWLNPQDPAKVQAQALVALASSLDPDVALRAVEASLCAQDKGLTVDKLLVADMSMRSRKKRLWAFDVSDPANPRLVHHDRVAHGSGSDPDGDGRPQAFSNTPDSHQTSLGLYRVAESYEGKHGGSRRLDGLFSRFNSNARNRAVVMHPSHYVSERHVGRSQGCPAVNYETMAALEKAGLDNAVLWIDGPDKQLGQEVAECAKQRREVLIAQARAEQRQRLEEQLKATPTWAVAYALVPMELTLASVFPPMPQPAPVPPLPSQECPACPLSRARFDCANDVSFSHFLTRNYS